MLNVFITFWTSFICPRFVLFSNVFLHLWMEALAFCHLPQPICAALLKGGGKGTISPGAAGEGRKTACKKYF